ncbi:unnamed protein product, partial [Sphagnum tenellum]
DTIAGISTQPGGAIAIVRMSGSRSIEALKGVTRLPSWELSPRKLVRATLLTQRGELLDDALVAVFPNPHSYTGEDLVEFNLHGGSFIASRLMETLVSYGIRQALPGEFSFRAVKNGKMSLFQAQAVADLIGASNQNALSLALEKLSGSQNQILDTLASDLRQLATLAEVGIDFADQDVEEVSLPHLKLKIKPLLDFLDRLASSFDRGFRLQEGIHVSFIGLPNAGKSSFFNCLLGEDRSIVSETPGTTRDTIRERLTLKGKNSTITLRLEDTAGLRKTDHPIELMGIQKSHASLLSADLILFVIDPGMVAGMDPGTDSGMAPESELEAIKHQWDTLIESSKDSSLHTRTIGILTKADQFDKQHLNSVRESLDNSLKLFSWATTSSLTGEGIPEAVAEIIRFCEKWTQRDPGELILTRLEHLNCVQDATHHLKRAQSASEIDLFASDIRQALHGLSPLIGETASDDILGKIFSNFCIGK